MKKEIIPSIIASTRQELKQRINKVRRTYGSSLDHLLLIHLDVMDGKFVPAHSLNFNFKLPKARYEAHLMIYNPEKWIRENAEKVDTIIFHIESTENPEEIIKLIKSRKKKVCIALNPETPIKKVKEYIDKVDKILILTVHPGLYGSSFLPETLEKIKELRRLYPELDIEVDGGINPDTIKKAYESGANLFVVGSYLQNSNNVKKALNKLEEQLK